MAFASTCVQHLHLKWRVFVQRNQCLQPICHLMNMVLNKLNFQYNIFVLNFWNYGVVNLNVVSHPALFEPSSFSIDYARKAWGNLQPTCTHWFVQDWGDDETEADFVEETRPQKKRKAAMREMKETSQRGTVGIGSVCVDPGTTPALTTTHHSPLIGTANTTTTPPPTPRQQQQQQQSPHHQYFWQEQHFGTKKGVTCP